MTLVATLITPLYADNKNIINNYLSPAPSFQGDWILTDLQLDSGIEKGLLETRIIHNSGEKTAQSDIVIAKTNLLGKAIKGERFHLSHSLAKNYKDAFIKIHFTTSKGTFNATLKYTPIRYGERTEAWSGELYLNKKVIALVVLEKGEATLKHEYQGEYSYEEARAIKQEDQKHSTPIDSNLYDLKNNKDELVFTCKQKKCNYTHSASELKDIPLLEHWAIEEPYYYETAGGAKAKVPTITFVNTQNGLWFVLNGRQLSAMLVSCIEFGKNGRLSSEETLCFINEEIKGENNMITLLESVEFWRDRSYQ